METRRKAMDDPHMLEHEAVLKIPINMENIREELSFYRHLRDLFRDYGKSAEQLDFIIKNLEESIKSLDDNITAIDINAPVLPDEEKILAAIGRHPYFKNPCDYPIRLITILKYLKHKGFNMNYADIDIYVDRLIQKMDNVKKVGKGLYMVKDRN